MKPVRPGILAFTFVSLATAASPALISIGAGPMFPYGEGARYANLGQRINAMAGFAITPTIEIGCEAAYNHYSTKIEDVKLAPGAFAKDYNHVIELNAAVKLFATEKENPAVYATFGAGLNFLESVAIKRTSQGSYAQDTTDEDAGVNIGGGVEFDVNERFTIGFCPRYHVLILPGENAEYFTATLYCEF